MAASMRSNKNSPSLLLATSVYVGGMGDLSHWFDLDEHMSQSSQYAGMSKIRLVCCFEENKETVKKRLEEKGYSILEEKKESKGIKPVHLIELKHEDEATRTILKNFITQEKLQNLDYFFSISTNIFRSFTMELDELSKVFKKIPTYIYCIEHGFSHLKDMVDKPIHTWPMGFSPGEYGVKLKYSEEKLPDLLKKFADKRYLSILEKLGVDDNKACIIPCYVKDPEMAKLFIKSVLASPFAKNSNKKILFHLSGMDAEQAVAVINDCECKAITKDTELNDVASLSSPIIIPNYWLSEPDYSLMVNIAKNTGGIAACSGDATLEAMMFMLPFYEIPMWKRNFMAGFINYIKELNPTLADYFQKQLNFVKEAGFVRATFFSRSGLLSENEKKEYMEFFAKHLTQENIEAWRGIANHICKNNNYYDHFDKLFADLLRKEFKDEVDIKMNARRNV